MERKNWMLVLMVAAVLVASRARAEDLVLAEGSLVEMPSDESVFDGLMPGDIVPDEELACYFGGAVVSFEVSDGSLVTQNGSIDTSQLNSVGNYYNTSGINNVVQSTGDNNNINIEVNIEVNLNTVTVTDSAGAVISTNQTLELGGVVGGVVQ